MKTFFKARLSSFVTLLVITVFAIVLTCNTHTDEKTKLGNIFTNSKSSTIYIKPANISFAIKPNSEKFFVDTKRMGTAKYLKECDSVFGAAMYDGEYEVYVMVNPTEVGSFDQLEKNYVNYIQQPKQSYIFKDYEIVGTETIHNLDFLHLYYTKKAGSYSEYCLVSDYAAIVDNQCVVVSFIHYSDKEQSLLDGKKIMDQKLSSTIKSISYGDSTKGKKNSDTGLKRILKYSFSLWIFLIPILYMLLTNLSVATESGEWQPDILGRERSKNILGVFAVMIVLHHLVQQIGAENAGFMSFLEVCGVLFVGLFFFYSGYGLLYSLQNKSGYLKGFFKKRLPAILVPFYVCILVFVLNNLVLQKQKISLNVLWQLLGVQLVNSHMWYIVEIAILYILFWLVYRLIKNEKIAMVVMTVFVLLMISGSLLLGHGDNWFQGEWWYNSTLAFILGMIVAKKQKKIVQVCKRNYTKIVMLTVIVFVGLFKANNYMLDHYGYWSEYSRDTWGQSVLDKCMTLPVQTAMVLSFTALVLLLSMKIKCDNWVLRFFGKISLELYLIHNLFIQAFSSIKGAGIYFALVLVCSVVAATILYNVDTCILCLYSKKPIPKRTKVLPVMVASLVASKKNVILSMNRIRSNPKKFIKTLIREMISLAITVITVAPLYLMVVNATKKKIIGEPLLIPGKSFLDNLNAINAVFAGPGGSIAQGITNSCIIAIFSAVFATYIGALTAYGFERYNFKWKKQLWFVMIGCLMIPQTAAYVGIYKMVVQFGLLNNLGLIIMLAFANPAAVYFIRMYLKNISLVEIGEAARIDGAGEFEIFNRIILPIIRPVLALQLTFSFVAAWNNGLAQTLFLYDWDKKTIAAYVKLLAGDKGGGLSPDSYALMLVATLAPMIVYILCSKSIVSSITLGAVKE